MKISKQEGAWRAEATDAGRHYIKHGDYPHGFWTSRKFPLSGSQESRSEIPAQHAPKKTDGAGVSATSENARRVESAKRISVTENVIAAGGELRVNGQEEKTNYDQRVAAAIRHGKVPEGKLLVIERGRTWGERIIRLQDPPEWMTAVLAPISVPGHLCKPHKIVAALKGDTDLLRVTTQVRSRACRLLQALITEAERRGHTVRLASHASRSPRCDSSGEGLLTVRISGHDFGVHLTQQYHKVEHVPTATELRRAERESWYRIPTSQAIA
ncbi:hypothetical protein ACFOY4_41010 [Actinomadura syzygii]|uniref:Uncharacterized protein n=1 Tax=Actinomadura syzygii TaxID=1427538 RepID=A0A5D0TQ19_9ACTN|nr:hypothetical protein [Actinomadura syzygii]TYC07345.1 hypothetical protein FXF65_43080 [Actinomadura syzygii]